jgi:hypothetical protein
MSIITTLAASTLLAVLLVGLLDRSIRSDRPVFAVVGLCALLCLAFVALAVQRIGAFQ